MKGNEVVILMGHPVTTNPFIIMLINMTVVFIVLVSLSFLIQLIHAIDPTKPPEVKNIDEANEADETEAIIKKLKETPAPEPEPVVEAGISPEVIAAISAAIASCGISGQVRAVRVAGSQHSAWRQNALNSGLTNV